jgi:predicted HD phosphohydrolase
MNTSAGLNEPNRNTHFALERMLGLLQADRAEHGLQCASLLRKHFPDDVELQLAGLFHDIGHTFADESAHGVEGALLVRPVLGDRVADLIELHVPAKRFLVTRFPGYEELLSPDSVTTLVLQGSNMSESEMDNFENHPFALEAMYLRLADDRAKVPGLFVGSISDWVPVIEELRRHVRPITSPLLVAS